METKKIEMLASLREDLIVFIGELIHLLPNDARELTLMQSFARSVIIADVMDYIWKNLVPLEPKVIAREDEYFLQNATMFEKLQNRTSQVNHFRTLWETTDDPHNKEKIWEWLHHFIQRAKEFKRRYP